jgi:hypothetical protein
LCDDEVDGRSFTVGEAGCHGQCEMCDGGSLCPGIADFVDEGEAPVDVEPFERRQEAEVVVEFDQA